MTYGILYNIHTTYIPVRIIATCGNLRRGASKETSVQARADAGSQDHYFVLPPYGELRSKNGKGSKNKPGTIVNPSLPTSARLETSGGYRVCRVRIWIALPCMIVQPGNSPMATVSCLDVRRTYSVPYCAVGIIAFCLFVHGRISCAESEFVGDSVPKALLIPTLRGKVTELVSPAFLA